MAEQKYVMVKIEDYERILELSRRESVCLLMRLYGQLTGGSFIDENDRWDIDPEGAKEAAEELRDLLRHIEAIFDREPYDEDVYTESERNLLHKVLNEREDWD